MHAGEEASKAAWHLGLTLSLIHVVIDRECQEDPSFFFGVVDKHTSNKTAQTRFHAEELCQGGTALQR